MAEIVEESVLEQSRSLWQRRDIGVEDLGKGDNDRGEHVRLCGGDRTYQGLVQGGYLDATEEEIMQGEGEDYGEDCGGDF